ncbi:MAG: hypothetical protein IIU63_08395, partial [Clostridia bacterium]|nr:hypothetical protein [Clostridia bacterium]
LGHTEVIDKAVTATCTATGLTEGKHCEVCGEVLVAQQTIDALGHTEVTDKAIAPTCTTTGLTEGKHCEVCGEVLIEQQIIDALGHTEVIDKAIAPTCTTTGLTEGKHCSECNEVLLGQEVVPATGHNYDAAVIDPTCTEKGYTTHTCHCGDFYVDSEVDALGHAPGDWIVDTEPAIGIAGSKHKECTVCGEVLETQVIEALTEAPTTEAPTIEAPTTEAPTTETPTTETPTVAPPITEPESEQSTVPETESDIDAETSGGCKGTISAFVALLALLGCFAIAWRPRKDN